MATAPQAAMEMPQEAGANPFADPNTMAVYDQMRQTMSPKEFGDEMLASASQIDPEAMAQFRDELSQIDLSPEDLDMLNNMVDEILANPEQYAAIRAKYMKMGAPEELLPEQFDPQFFAAMNMAVDQLIAEPAGVQAFAMGGIAELKPIAKAIASYGRNGDTMLAHITPAEARMLRRRGGSGTINPVTGLPEFFLKKAFKSLGKAIKSFASSTVGKIVTTVALGFFLGPAAAAAMGVGAGTAAGVAISGFVGGAGSTLLAGGNLKDALKAGAIGGLTAGAVAGFSGAPLIGGTNLTPGQALSGQVDRFTGMFKSPAFPQYTAQGALTDNATANAAREAYAGELYKTNPEAFYNPNATPPEALSDFTAKKSSLVLNPQTGNLEPPPGFEQGQTRLPGGQILTQNVPIKAAYDPTNMVAANPSDFGVAPSGTVPPPYKLSTIGESFSKIGEGLGMGDKPASFDTFKQGATDLFSPGPTDAQVTAKARELMSTTPGMSSKDAMVLARGELGAPGFLRTYGPATVAGIGAIGALGGFKAAPAQPSAMRDELLKPVTQRIAEGGNQRNYYVQNLPGVKYDQYGAPIFGQYEPLPTYNTGLGIESLIAPRRFAEGGEVTAANFDEVAYTIANPDVAAEIAQGKFKNAYEHYVQYGKAEGRAAFSKTDTAAAAAKTDAETKEKQTAARGAVATAKAARKAKGSTSAYQNISAGLAFDAPEGFAADAIAKRQAAFAPTLNKFIAAGAANTATLNKPYSPTVVDQPYNRSTGYANVFNPAVTPINYNNTPVAVQPGVYTPPAFVDNSAELARRQKIIDDAARQKIIDDAARQKIIDDAARQKAIDDAARQKIIDDAAAAAAAEARRLGQRAYTDQEVRNYLLANPTATDRTIAQAMFDFNVSPYQVAQVTGLQGVAGPQSIDARYQAARSATAGNAAAVAAQNAADAVTGQSIRDYFAKTPGMTDRQIATYMDQNAIDFSQISDAFKGTAGAIAPEEVLRRYTAATAAPAKLLNMGGIATLGTGGYPRRTGQINGPGTGTSDSIPAMLSDGEFVMTAKAVRGAGKGDRRAGAKRMYALMNQLEKNAARG